MDGSGPLQGRAVDFIAAELGLEGFAWDRAQVSICYPGYPQPMPGESPARARYRRERDAAHVDGLLREGSQQRRHLREYHGFILGIPMVEFNADASPFVVWEGSHEIMRNTFAERFAGIAPEQWGDEDITGVYHAPVKSPSPAASVSRSMRDPGEAFLAHRLVLHGMAPWREIAQAGRRWPHDLLFPAGYLRAPGMVT